MNRLTPIALVFAAFIMMGAGDLAERVSELEAQVHQLNLSVRDASATGGLCILFGAFCALWAQHTGRSAWLWFFLGLFFSVITVMVLLYKNSKDPTTASMSRPNISDTGDQSHAS